MDNAISNDPELEKKGARRRGYRRSIQVAAPGQRRGRSWESKDGTAGGYTLVSASISEDVAVLRAEQLKRGSGAIC